MRTKKTLNNNRIIRHFRIRKKVVGNVERPRLSIRPSLSHLEAQIVNDFESKTLVGFTTKAKDFAKLSGCKKGDNVKAAVAFGKYVAKKAQEKGYSKVVFDRGGYLYHGRVKAFADAAREGGLQF